MDARKARWSQIVFWEKPDIQKLHERERWLIQEERGTKRWLSLGLVGWESPYDIMTQMQSKYGLKPYWVAKMDENMKSDRFQEWERGIFPVWKSLEAEDKEEIDILHKQDWAILNCGKKPDRFTSMPKTEEEMKERRAQWAS